MRLYHIFALFDQLDKSRADVMHDGADLNKRELANKLPAQDSQSRSILASRHF